MPKDKYWNVHPLKVVPDDDRGSCKGKHSSDVFLGVFATTKKKKLQLTVVYNM